MKTIELLREEIERQRQRILELEGTGAEPEAGTVVDDVV
jgi:hypothetical protein